MVECLGCVCMCVFDFKVAFRVIYGFLVGVMSVCVSGDLLGVFLGVFMGFSLRVYNTVYVLYAFNDVLF